MLPPFTGYSPLGIVNGKDPDEATRPTAAISLPITPTSRPFDPDILRIGFKGAHWHGISDILGIPTEPPSLRFILKARFTSQSTQPAAFLLPVTSPSRSYYEFIEFRVKKEITPRQEWDAIQESVETCGEVECELVNMTMEGRVKCWLMGSNSASHGAGWTERNIYYKKKNPLVEAAKTCVEWAGKKMFTKGETKSGNGMGDGGEN
jgi:hypothetical protein